MIGGWLRSIGQKGNTVQRLLKHLREIGNASEHMADHWEQAMFLAKHPDNLQENIMAAPMQSTNANSRQVGGKHYGLTDYQHWDFVADFNLDYFQGQVTKYIIRWKEKNGLEDLLKARHFLDKYIELEQRRIAAEVAEKEQPAEGSAEPHGYVDQDR